MARLPLPNPLNICLVCRNFPGSDERGNLSFLRLIAKGLVKKSHEVTVLAHRSPSRREYVEDEGIRIRYLGEGRNQSRRDDFAYQVKQTFMDLHREKPFHLVHSMDSSAASIGKFKKYYRIAMAYDVNATQMGQLFSIMGMGQETLSSVLTTGIALTYKFLQTYLGGDRRLLSTADGVFVGSPQQRLTLERYYLYPDFKIYSVPYGAELSHLEPLEKSVALLEKHGLSLTNEIALTVSDMTEVGEMANLLEAFQKVANKKSQARLLILGTGPKQAQIERIALDFALGGRTIFLGAVPEAEIAQYVALCSVYINLSARTTGFEQSLLASMVQKKCIIGSEVSPLSTLIEHGKDGFLARPADVQEISNLLLGVFNAHVPTVELGDNAHRKVLDLFEPQKMIESTLDAYYSILRNTGWYRKR